MVEFASPRHLTPLSTTNIGYVREQLRLPDQMKRC